MLHEVEGDEGGEASARLQREYEQRFPGTAREPLDREEEDDRHLRDHEQLKDVRRRSLVGLVDDAVHSDMADNQEEPRE